MLPRALLLIVGAWGALALLLVGLGALFRAGSRAPVRDGADALLTLWLGWGVLLLILQVWHLVLAVDARALAACGALAAVGLALEARPLGAAAWRAIVRAWPWVLLGLGVTLWLANRAMDGPRFGDAGLFLPVQLHERADAAVPGRDAVGPRGAADPARVGGVILDAPRWGRALVCVAVLLYALLPFAEGQTPWLELQQLAPLPRSTVREVHMPAGLVVRVPERQTCWNTPPPCTPELDPGLRLRRPDDLGSGFKIEPGSGEAVRSGT